jgi:hypothetical protein
MSSVISPNRIESTNLEIPAKLKTQISMSVKGIASSLMISGDSDAKCQEVFSFEISKVDQLNIDRIVTHKRVNLDLRWPNQLGQHNAQSS